MIKQRYTDEFVEYINEHDKEIKDVLSAFYTHRYKRLLRHDIKKLFPMLKTFSLLPIPEKFEEGEYPVIGFKSGKYRILYDDTYGLELKVFFNKTEQLKYNEEYVKLYW